MRKHQIENISWQEVLWQRPYDLGAVQNILAQLANLTPRGAVIWEIRGRNGQVSHLLGADKQYIGKIEEVFRAHGDVKFHTLPRAARLPVGMAKQLRVTHPQLSLKTDIAEAVIRAGLAAMTEDRDGTELVLQVILGMAYPPAPIPASLPDPHATWLEVLIGDVHQATAESRKAVREKAEQYSFQAMIRIGASGANGLSRLRSILSALKVLESAGVRIYTDSENPERLTRVHVPWHFPLKLSVKELSNFLLLPTGEAELPGTPGLHPKLTLPPLWYQSPKAGSRAERCFALSMDQPMQTKERRPSYDQYRKTADSRDPGNRRDQYVRRQPGTAHCQPQRLLRAGGVSGRPQERVRQLYPHGERALNMQISTLRTCFLRQSE